MRDNCPPRTYQRAQHNQNTPQRRDSQAARPQEGSRSDRGDLRGQGESPYSYRQGQRRGWVQQREPGRREQFPRQGEGADAPPPQGRDTRRTRDADWPGGQERRQHRRRDEQAPRRAQSGSPPQQGDEVLRERDDARRGANVRQPRSPGRRQERPRIEPQGRQQQGPDSRRRLESQRRSPPDQQGGRATNRAESTPPARREQRFRQQPGGQRPQGYSGSSPAQGVHRERRGSRDSRGGTDRADAPTELVRLGRSDEDDERARASGEGSEEASSDQQEGSDSALPPRDPETGQFVPQNDG